MKDIISKRLDELVDSVLDMDYTKNKRVQSREMGIPYPTFIKYYNGTSECSATNLIKIAEYYNVSVDYLLGRTDVKTLDMDISGCCKLTGLSEAAAKKIIKSNFSDVISQIIENPEFDEMINALSSALCFRHLALPNKKVMEQINKELESNPHSPFWQYALATAKGGLSPYYKQQLSELICKVYDKILLKYFQEDLKELQSKGENDNG